MKEINNVEILKAVRNDLLIKYAILRNTEAILCDNKILNEVISAREGLSEAITSLDFAIK